MTVQALSPLGLPCGLTVTTEARPGAMVALDIMDPCQGNARVVVEHSGLNLTGQTDACNATFILSYWVRDRNRLTGRNGLSIEQAINEHCARPAAFVGMTDRGTLEVGKKVHMTACNRLL